MADSPPRPYQTPNAQKGRLGNIRDVRCDARCLGPAWANTIRLVATEFGRTAAVKCAGGTDHGTGSVAPIAGTAADSLALDPERVGRSLFAQATHDRPMVELIQT